MLRTAVVAGVAGLVLVSATGTQSVEPTGAQHRVACQPDPGPENPGYTMQVSSREFCLERAPHGNAHAWRVLRTNEAPWSSHC